MRTVLLVAVVVVAGALIVASTLHALNRSRHVETRAVRHVLGDA